MKIVIEKCKRADDYYEKNNQYFKDRIPYKAWIHNIISTRMHGSIILMVIRKIIKAL